VGIVCPDRRQADALLSLFGRRVAREHFVTTYHALCIFTDEGPPCIELVVPDGGTLASFNRGVGGIHHIAYEVEDLDAVSRRLRDGGVELLEKTPIDAGPIRINFLPPSSTRGLIVELIEPK
jgi:methylmalonyl-CoA/ethylmalonyl-CoA epimerase